MSQKVSRTIDYPEHQNLGRRLALVIASYDYPDVSTLRSLVAPPRDAEDLLVLKDVTLGGFNVKTLLNRFFSVVIEAIDDFFLECHPDDLALLYFSGHGVKDVDGQLYFAMSNTNLKKLPSTAIKAQWVNERMLRSKAKQKVLFLLGLLL